MQGQDLNLRPPGYEPDELPTALPCGVLPCLIIIPYPRIEVKYYFKKFLLIRYQWNLPIQIETKNKSKIRLSQSARAGPFLKPLQIIVSALIQNLRTPLHIIIADCRRAECRQTQAADCAKTFKIRILAFHNKNTSKIWGRLPHPNCFVS